MNRGQLVAQRTSPVGENVSNGHIVGDGERQIEVGEPIAAGDRKRADSGSGNDSWILLG